MTEFIHKAKNNWSLAWSFKAFRIETLLGMLFNLVVLSFLPIFFNYIEKRNGTLLNDPLLDMLPYYNVSLPLVLFFIATFCLLIYRAIESPRIFITFLFSFLFLTLFRIAAIYYVPLNPPDHLISLNDPIANLMYVGGFKTKDLFFSGHTSTIFLIALCLQGRYDRLFATACTIAIGSLLLIQHVHYTMDVLSAPLFAYGCYYITTRSGLIDKLNKVQDNDSL